MFFYNQLVGKQGKFFEYYVVMWWDQCGLLFFIMQYGMVEVEIFFFLVGMKIESVLIVIKIVFMIFMLWQKVDWFGVWQFGVEQQYFVGGGVGEINYYELLGGGFMYVDVEGFIFFFVDQCVVLCWCFDGVVLDLIREQCGGMFMYILNKV